MQIGPNVRRAILTWYGAVHISLRPRSKTDPRRLARLTFVGEDGKRYRKWHHYARVKYCALKRVHLPPYIEVDHEDGNKTNDRLSNLRELTKRENIQESYRLGQHKRAGESNGRALVTAKQVVALRKLYARSSKTVAKCVRQLRLPCTVVQAQGIVAGRSWATTGPRSLLVACQKKNANVSVRYGVVTEADVVRLRKYRAKTNKPYSECVADLGLPISGANAWSICRGTSWKNAGGPIETKLRSRAKS